MSSLTDDKPSLTPRQREIYEFLKDKILNRGYGPTVREIGAEFGIRSPNGVMCHLKALEKKGLITRESHMSRAIQLADSPHQRMTLRLLGQISAGQPLQAEADDERVDFATLFDTETHFCLKARDNSLADCQIHRGDYIVVKRVAEASNGDIAVCTINGGVDVRHCVAEGDRMRLDATQPGALPSYSDQSELLGVIVGVIRRY